MVNLVKAWPSCDYLTLWASFVETGGAVVGGGGRDLQIDLSFTQPSFEPEVVLSVSGTDRT